MAMFNSKLLVYKGIDQIGRVPKPRYPSNGLAFGESCAIYTYKYVQVYVCMNLL